VVSKVFRHKRSEVTGIGEEYIKRNFTIVTYQIVWGDKARRTRWEGYVAHMGERRVSYKVWMGRFKRTGTLGRCRSRWEDNIKVDIQVVGCEGWTGLTWLRIRTGGVFW
jgi:hypothetical protein